MRHTSSMSYRPSHTPVLRTVSRWVLGTAGILWVALAASFCGCSPMAPVNGWAMNQKGKSLYKKGQYAQARGEFERALMDSPYSADYAYNVAAAMDQQGDNQAAEKMYRHALTLDPGHQPAYHGMAAMMMEDGRTTEATDLVNTWAVTQPYSEDAATELGWVKGEQGDFDGADRELRRALRQNPRNTRALTQLGRVHGKSGRRGDAASDYARSLFMDPDQTEAQVGLAALNQDASGSPALQLATAMPLYDPALQAGAYPAFTSPQSRVQPQMASGNMSAPGWNGSPASVSAYSAPMGYGMSPHPGVTDSNPNGPTRWSQPQMQTMNGEPNEPTPTYADVVSSPYSIPQPYNTSRPGNSFFQPQQSFHGSMPGEMPTMSQSDMVYTDSLPPGASDAPTWNTPPAMNASFGNAIPAEQISSAPVVPAF